MLICIPWVAIGPDVIYTVALKVLKPNPVDKVVAIYKNSLQNNSSPPTSAGEQPSQNNPMNLNGKVVSVR